ncbi:major capsid protein [Microbacterium arborescens]|uniref:major capsid protein n=1 Tax=Microbacterium arborescens TaxID=33883 RepID=UPI000DF802A7|nr:major capsid protein [Microbacterium arborescens]
MALWTDIIDPAELTGYVRAAQEDYEAAQGTLARYLPNREVPDIVVRFRAGANGLVAEASYRAYDAEPLPGKQPGGKRVILELPALSETIVVSEYDQLRTRGASDDTLRRSILNTARQVVRAISDRAERLRGIVINTGVATIPEIGAADSFGRSANHDVTATSLWADPDADRIEFLEGLIDTYSETNGAEPGRLVMTRRVYRALAAGTQFRTSLVGGGSRPATEEQVRAVISGAGLPEIEIFNRRTASGRVLDDRKLFLLPEPVEPTDWQGTQLGATFWGQTLTSTAEEYGIEESEQPGIVAGVYRGEKPPMIAEVVGDSINLPVLANANLSLAATVLA